MKNKKSLPNIFSHFPEWYQEVICLAELAENCDVKGCIIILPYAYSIWENMTLILNKGIKKMGALNMAFPLLIPYSYFEKEKDHVEGFAPEVAVVSHAGGRKLEEPLVVRPTSEVIIHNFFKNKINSWRNLPLKVNQWCSVVRWEKRPRAFLRTSEFWWQEGHTAHENYEEAISQAKEAIFLYEDFCRNILAIPVIMGKKPDYERFAGADSTWTIEGMMQDGKAVQMGTSHLLGEGFTKAQNIEFQDKDMKMKAPFLTSWGVTTRLIGTLIMVHGDQNGLVMPPFIAPILFSLIPIYKNDYEKNIIMPIFHILIKILDFYNISYFLDIREDVSPGMKFFDSEKKGIPFRIELGLRDFEMQHFTLFQRDILMKSIHSFNLLNQNEDFYLFFNNLKDLMQKRIYEKALLFRNKNIFQGNLLSEFGPKLLKENGFYISYWCGQGEKAFKEFQSSVRCLLDEEFIREEIFELGNLEKKCCVHNLACGDQLKICLIARSY
jgi:prolyl-tRNA synthetase